jgi:hypothetical protein
MNAVVEANARLRDLGYEETDARVEATHAGDRLRVTGALVNDTGAKADEMRAILRMLPSKADLLAYRFLLGLPPWTAPLDALPARCAWCGSFSSDGRRWFRTNLPAPPPTAPLTGGICPSCFARLAPTTPYPSRSHA